MAGARDIDIDPVSLHSIVEALTCNFSVHGTKLAKRDTTIADMAIDVTALSKARDEAERKARMNSSN
jgi:hypothetical protein